MGLKEVKEDVIKEAEDEADRIKKEAEEKKKEILEEARQEAEEIKQQAENEIENEKESMRRQKLSNARMKAKKLKLERKRDYIQKVFEDFRHRLEKLDRDQREKFVETCIDKAEFEIGEIKTSEDFIETVENLGHEVEEIENEGVVLVSEDGEKRREFTVDKIVENYRKNHRKKVADTLFG